MAQAAFCCSVGPTPWSLVPFAFQVLDRGGGLLLQLHGGLHGPLLHLAEMLDLLGQILLGGQRGLADPVGLFDQAEDHHLARTACSLLLCHGPVLLCEDLTCYRPIPKPCPRSIFRFPVRPPLLWSLSPRPGFRLRLGDELPAYALPAGAPRSVPGRPVCPALDLSLVRNQLRPCPLLFACAACLSWAGEGG